MADVHVWEKGEIYCKAVGLAATATAVKFNFYKGSEKIGSVDASLMKDAHLALSENRAPVGGGRRGAVSGGSSAPSPPSRLALGAHRATQAALAMFEAPECGAEEAFVKLSYKVEVDGTEKQGFVQDVYVWAKTIKVKSLKHDDGSPLPRARLKVTQQNPADPSPKGTSALERVTGDDGELVLELVFPAEANIAWQRPFAFKSWEKGTASSGRERFAKLERGFIAKLVFPDPAATPVPDPRPTADQTKKQHIQWVNVQPSVEVDPPPSWGSKIKIRVGAVNPSTVMLNEDKVYLKAKWDSGNVERVTSGPLTQEQTDKGLVLPDPEWPAKDKEHTEEKVITASNKEVVFELELGPSGGDKVLVEVGGTADCADAKVEIVNWRLLMYELKFPTCMTSFLEKSTVPLESDDGSPPGGVFPLLIAAPGTEVALLKAATSDWFAERLQKGFVAFYPRASHEVGDDDAKFSPAIVKAGYLKPYKSGCGADDADVFVYGDWVDRSGAWLPSNNRCVQVTLVHAALSSKVTSGNPVYLPVRKEVTTAADVDLDVKAATGGWMFEWAMGGSTKKPGVKEVRWKAVIDPVANPTHPGVNAGQRREGAIAVDGTNATRVSCKILRVKVPEEVKAWLGPASATKCPIEIVAQVNKAYGINGSAGGGKQVMVASRPATSIASTICHELGHSMGLTVFPTGSRKKPPPRGLPYPDVVPTGLVYDDSVMHQGSHCAFGIGASDRAIAQLNNKKGTCIMFGSGGDEQPPSRDKYCPDCEGHLKARTLSDICTYYSDRNPEDL